METYKLLINKIAKTDINFFSLDYKEDNTIKYYIKTAFLLFEHNINSKNKFKNLSQTLNSFLLTDPKNKEEFILFFYKIQKTYNVINRLVYNYKLKKAKIVVNTDFGLNELNENEKNVITLFHNNSKYLFNINDLIKIINSSLTNSYLFFSEPKSIKNPYNNLPFSKSMLYNIYFYIRCKTDLYPELLCKYFQTNFNLTRFRFLNDNLLREHSIKNYVYKSHDNDIKEYIIQMINSFNLYCHKINPKNKIIIDKDFPDNILVKIMKPYLFLYVNSIYNFHPQKKNQYDSLFKLSMIRFNKFNPKFGRKQIKLKLRITKAFKKIYDKEVVFNDKCIKYMNDSEIFFSEHLICHESLVRINFYNSPYDDDDTEEEDVTEEEDEEEDDEEEDDEEEDVTEEDDIDYENENENDSIS